MSDRLSITLSTPAARERARKVLDRVPDGYVVEFRKDTRALWRNSRMWGKLTDISRQVIWYGEKLIPGEWKDVFTAALKKQKAVPGIDGGFVVLGAHTSRMTNSEMSDLDELMNAFGAEHGVRFKAPRDYPGPPEKFMAETKRISPAAQQGYNHENPRGQDHS